MRLVLPTTPAPQRDERDVLQRGPDFLELESGLGRVSFRVTGEEGPPSGELLAAFEDGRPAAFYALDREFVPNWCPMCVAMYCKDHWRVWEVFDPDFPAWHEETRGACPNGHERMLSD